MSRPLNIVLAILIAAIVTVIAVFAQNSGSDSNVITSLPTPTPTPVADPLDPGSFFLEVTTPAEAESVVDTPAFTIVGRTRADAVVSINDVIVEPNVEGIFTLTQTLIEGPTIFEIVASVPGEPALDYVLAVIYAP